jgi:hypothetical protein
VGGYCAAQPVAGDLQNYVRVFAHDDARVYWANGTYIDQSGEVSLVLASPLDNDGGPGIVLYDAGAVGTGVARLADGTVFLGTNDPFGSVLRVDVATGTATVLVPSASVTSIAVNSSRVLWTESSAQHVRAVPRDGGPVVDLISPAATPWSIVADEERAIWLEGDAVDTDGGTTLTRAAIGEHVLATGARHEYPRDAAPQLLTSDLRYAYWTDGTTVYRTPKSKLGEDVAIGSLPPGEGAVSAMMADGPWVYLLTGPPGTTDRRLMVVPKCGDGPARALSGPLAQLFTDLVADAKYVYFASYLLHGILRVPKP